MLRTVVAEGDGIMGCVFGYTVCEVPNCYEVRALNGLKVCCACQTCVGTSALLASARQCSRCIG